MKQLDQLIRKFYLQVIAPPAILFAIVVFGILYNIHSKNTLFDSEFSVFIFWGGLLSAVLIGLRLNVKWTIESLEKSNEPRNFELRRRNLTGQKIHFTTHSEREKLKNIYRDRIYNGEPISLPKNKKVIYYSKWRSIIDTLMFWGFLAAGIYKTQPQEIEELDTGTLIGIFGLAMLLFFMGFNSFWKFFNQNPALIISGNGIETKKGFFISWEKVSNYNIDPKFRRLEIEYMSDNKSKSEIIDFDLMSISKEKLEYYVELYFRKNIKTNLR